MVETSLTEKLKKRRNIHYRYIEELKLCKKGLDTECAHIEADSIICDLLIELGFKDVVDEYDKIGKWYA